MQSKATKEADTLNGILESIGKKLQELRIRKGYTSHADFAADHDLPRIQYWRIEKGKANITLKSLHRILEIHGITVEELFQEVFSKRQQKE